MKKLMKALFVAALVLVSATLLSISAYASSIPELSPNSRSDFQQYVIENVEGMVYWSIVDPIGIDLSGKIELGTRLNVYRLEDTLEEITDMHWYPVLFDGQIVAIADIHVAFDSYRVGFWR